MIALCLHVTHLQVQASGVRKRGRPAGSKPRGYEHLLKQLARPDAATSAQVVNSSKNAQPLLWYCACGNPNHMRLMQLRSVIQSETRIKRAKREKQPSLPSHALWCRVCELPAGRGQVGSALERRCYSILTQHFPDQPLYIESKVFGGLVQSKADLYLPKVQLAVYVDGSQHTSEGGMGAMHGESITEQARRDAAVDSVVKSGQGLSQGVKGLLRLHWHDQELWHAAITRALRAARDPGVTCFVHYTKSYM